MHNPSYVHISRKYWEMRTIIAGHTTRGHALLSPPSHARPHRTTAYHINPKHPSIPFISPSTSASSTLSKPHGPYRSHLAEIPFSPRVMNPSQGSLCLAQAHTLPSMNGLLMLSQHTRLLFCIARRDSMQLWSRCVTARIARFTGRS